MKQKTIKPASQLMGLFVILLCIGVLTTNKVQASPNRFDPALTELRERIEQLAASVRFEYDNTALPAGSIEPLNQIARLMREYGETYYYVIWVHSYESGQSDAYALDYSNRRSQGLRDYLVNLGISRDVLIAQGIGAAALQCDNYQDPDCYHRNNRLEIMVHERIDGEDKQATPGPVLDRSESNYQQMLTRVFEKYFVGGDNTLDLQVNVNPCRITVIETYSHAGNPHTRVWTFNTNYLAQMSPSSDEEFRIELYTNNSSGTLFDSRTGAREPVHQITLAGFAGNARAVRDELEHAWYNYREACNEEPEAY